MKMIMPIKSGESGQIFQNLSPGSVIFAGDLLASLTIKDPSMVKKILPHKGPLDLPVVPVEHLVVECLANLLSGYTGTLDSVV